MRESTQRRWRRWHGVVVTCVVAVVGGGLVATPANAADRPVPIAPGTGSALVEQLRRAVGPSVTAFADQPIPAPCWYNVTIRSDGNSRYVAAEQGWTGGDYGMLRARTTASAIGNWEKFTMCRNPDNWKTAISVATTGGPRYWEADTFQPGDRIGLLFADAQGCCDAYELFTTYKPPGHQTWIYSPIAGRYVSAQLDFGGTLNASLRARSGSVGPWESFTW